MYYCRACALVWDVVQCPYDEVIHQWCPEHQRHFAIYRGLKTPPAKKLEVVKNV